MRLEAKFRGKENLDYYYYIYIRKKRSRNPTETLKFFTSWLRKNRRVKLSIFCTFRIKIKTFKNQTLLLKQLQFFKVFQRPYEPVFHVCSSFQKVNVSGVKYSKIIPDASFSFYTTITEYTEIATCTISLFL